MTRDDVRAMLARFDEQSAVTRRFFAEQAAKSQRHFDAAAKGQSRNIQRIREGQGVLIEEIDGPGACMDRHPHPDA
jgi:hypothetical protein